MEKDVKTSEGKTNRKNVCKEAEYTIQEFVKQSEYLFGVPSECVKTALEMKNVESTTVSLAKEIVKNFMRKEVE